MPMARAAVLEDYETPLQVWEVRVDDPGPGEVLVRIAASGVCHTDEHVITGDLPLPLPMVLGHEAAGVVEAVGAGATRLKPGDRVVLSWLPACGHCQACRSGWTGMCRTTSKAAEKGTLWDGVRRLHAGTEPLNVMSLTGTFATYAVVPEAGAVAIDPDVPLREAALLGCSATTGYGAVAHSAKVTPGASVTVIGAGGVGLHVVQASRLFGAERIIAVDRFPARLEAARRLGATDVVNPADGDALTQILDRTDGMGTDFAFEVVGTPATIAQAFNVVRPGGTAVVVGVAPPHEEVSLNAFAFPSQGKTLKGTWYGSGDFAQDVQALIAAQRQGRIDLGAFVGETFALDDVNRAFEALRSGSVTRPLVVLDADA
jgi:S-(hydroxymethyl)glutathione dehydrogenase/alcohol dehydrogenase